MPLEGVRSRAVPALPSPHRRRDSSSPTRAATKERMTMQRPLALFLSPVTATVLLLGAPAPAIAASTFYGIVIHVSDNSIKVEDTRTKQTLAFEIVPHFDQLFSADGKTTYQMKDIKA